MNEKVISSSPPSAEAVGSPREKIRRLQQQAQTPAIESEQEKAKKARQAEYKEKRKSWVGQAPTNFGALDAENTNAVKEKRKAKETLTAMARDILPISDLQAIWGQMSHQNEISDDLYEAIRLTLIELQNVRLTAGNLDSELVKAMKRAKQDKRSAINRVDVILQYREHVAAMPNSNLKTAYILAWHLYELTK